MGVIWLKNDKSFGKTLGSYLYHSKKLGF